MEIQKFQIERLSQYRASIMGFAITYILFHHLSLLGVTFSDNTLSGFRSMGACGVDIFLILSSFGLTYSLKNNPSAISFYKKRLLRIAPCFLISLMSVISVETISLIKNDCNILQLVKMLINTPRFHLYCMWYIFALIPLYSMFPIVYNYVFGGGNIDKKCNIILTITVLNSLLFVCASYDMGIKDFYGTIMLTLYRIPVFFCGMFLLASYRPILKICNSHIVFCLSFIIALYTPPAIRYVAFFFLSLSCLKYLIVLFSKFKTIGYIFSKIGGVTLELYLAHMCVFTRIDYLHIEDMSLKILAAYLLSFVFAYILHILSSFISKK